MKLVALKVSTSMLSGYTTCDADAIQNHQFLYDSCVVQVKFGKLGLIVMTVRPLATAAEVSLQCNEHKRRFDNVFRHRARDISSPYTRPSAFDRHVH